MMVTSIFFSFFYNVYENPSSSGSLTVDILLERMKGYKPFPKRQILDSSKLKEFPEDNFKLDENCRMFAKSVENTGGKGEIARYEQFLLFPQCFHETCKNQGLVWDRVNVTLN